MHLNRKWRKTRAESPVCKALKSTAFPGDFFGKNLRENIFQKKKVVKFGGLK